MDAAVTLILALFERPQQALEKRNWRQAAQAIALTLDLTLSGLVAVALSIVVPPSIGAAPAPSLGSTYPAES